MKYACIDRHRGEYPVQVMCNALEVTRSGYYAWRTREQSARAAEDMRLSVEISASFHQHRQRYGSPRIHDALRQRGIRTSRKRVERLMRAAQLRARVKRRFVVTTLSEHSEAIAPNLLNRQFEVGEPDRAWVADITYVPTGEGWLYLAVVLDVGTRQAVADLLRQQEGRLGQLAFEPEGPAKPLEEILRHPAHLGLLRTKRLRTTRLPRSPGEHHGERYESRQ